MARSHLYRPIQDAQGNLRTGAQVRVFDDGQSTLTDTPLFASNVGTATLPPVHTVTSGIIDFYTEEPTRFRIGVKVGDEPEVIFEAVDTSEPGYTLDDEVGDPDHIHPPHEHAEYYSADNPPPAQGTQANEVNLLQVIESTTLTDGHHSVFANGADITVTLPTAVGREGRTFTIKNLNATSLTVASEGGTFDATANRILAQYDALTVISDGTNWGVV